MKFIKRILLPLFFVFVSANVLAAEAEDVQQEIKDYCLSTVPHENDTQDQVLVNECIKEQNSVLNREGEPEMSDCAPGDPECSQAESQDENVGHESLNSGKAHSKD